MDGKEPLKRVLTRLIYRVTAHGVSRLNQVANPILTFTATSPPRLQLAEIPRPETPIDATRVLAGIEADQSFTGAHAKACNAALVQFRRDLEAFMTQ